MKKLAKFHQTFCQTIKVVMSPNGLKAPPAFAAITIFMQPIATKAVFFLATAITTAAMTRAVVRLSATGEMKNANNPVIQNIALKDSPLDTSTDLKAPKYSVPPWYSRTS